MNVGDWVYCEFKLGQIAEMDGERITDFACGFGRLGSMDLRDRCFPLEMKYKRISDEFRWHSERLHREGAAGLNFPRIHNWLVDAWVTACQHADDATALAEDYRKVQTFAEDVLRRQVVDSGYGFELMRAR